MIKRNIYKFNYIEKAGSASTAILLYNCYHVTQQVLDLQKISIVIIMKKVRKSRPVRIILITLVEQEPATKPQLDYIQGLLLKAKRTYYNAERDSKRLSKANASRLIDCLLTGKEFQLFDADHKSNVAYEYGNAHVTKKNYSNYW